MVMVSKFLKQSSNEQSAAKRKENFFAKSSGQVAEAPVDRLVVCVTGMPGAGKSVFAEVSKDLGFEIFRMGDDVRMEAERRRIPPSDENLGAIMMQLRQSGGPVAIAVLCKRRIEKEASSELVLIDGIRNINEFHYYKKLGKAVLVSIHTSPQSRFEFLKARARSDSPSIFASFEARDRRELAVGIGEAIALADQVIINSGTLDELKDKAYEVLKSLKEAYAKEKKRRVEQPVSA